MMWIKDLILIALFGYLCWKLTDGFRRDVILVVPVLLFAGILRFVVLPEVMGAIIGG